MTDSFIAPRPNGKKKMHRHTTALTDAQGIPLSGRRISSLTQEQLFSAVFRQSIMGRPFNDTKLWAFSRRYSNGVISEAQAVYANSVILRASSAYFDACEASLV
jgi:hypothetical protein